MPKKQTQKKRNKRLVKRIMKGCAKRKTRQQRGGNLDTPTFQVGISKFYPMNELSTDVQRNSVMDRGVMKGGRRYSRRYLDPMRKTMRGGYLQGLTPLDYNSNNISSNQAVQPIVQKYSDSNPYLV